MNPSSTSPSYNELQSFYTFLALQLSRIHTTLYPSCTNPVHVSGPRRPDMFEQEQQMQPDYFTVDDSLE